VEEGRESEIGAGRRGDGGDGMCEENLIHNPVQGQSKKEDEKVEEEEGADVSNKRFLVKWNRAVACL
jgi:hypothetical protein